MAYPPRLIVPLVLIALAACGDSPQEPRAAAAAPRMDGVVDGGSGGIVVPVTGTTDGGKTFKGTLVIAGAGFDPQVGPILSYRIRGVVTPGSGQDQGGDDAQEDVSLSFAPIDASYSSMDADEDCIQLVIRPPVAFDPATKTTVAFDVSFLGTRMLPGPANLIAELICANDRMGAYDWENAPPPPQ